MMDFSSAGKLRDDIQRALDGRLFGLENEIDAMLIGLLSRGHTLLTGVPGLAKTMLVHALARLLDLSFRRVQFTPDLMPGDILGSEVLDIDPETGQRSFRYLRGPIFCNLLLADEINRTPPRTQAALLEAMQERSVSVGNQTYPLEPPFAVYATMNPLEQEGTYVLPEAELDRFLLQIRLGYPNTEDEQRIAAAMGNDPLDGLEPASTGEQIIALQKRVQQVTVPDALIARAVHLVRQTRPQDSRLAAVRDKVRFGAGPRASQALIRCSAARALLYGRPAALQEDLDEVLLPVLRHRLVLNFDALAEGMDVDKLIAAIRDEDLG